MLLRVPLTCPLRNGFCGELVLAGIEEENGSAVGHAPLLRRGLDHRDRHQAHFVMQHVDPDSELAMSTAGSPSFGQ